MRTVGIRYVHVTSLHLFIVSSLHMIWKLGISAKIIDWRQLYFGLASPMLNLDLQFDQIFYSDFIQVLWNNHAFDERYIDYVFMEMLSILIQ